MFSLSVSQGNAVCQSDGAAGVRDRLHLRAAMHTAGGAAGPGQLGREEVRHFTLFMPNLKLMHEVLKSCDLFLPVTCCIPRTPAVHTAAFLLKCSVAAETLW